MSDPPIKDAALQLHECSQYNVNLLMRVMTGTGWSMVFKIQCMPCGRLALIQSLDVKVPYNVTTMNGTRFGDS